MGFRNMYGKTQNHNVAALDKSGFIKAAAPVHGQLAESAGLAPSTS